MGMLRIDRNRVLELRQQGLTMEVIATRMGTSASYIQQVVSGKRGVKGGRRENTKDNRHIETEGKEVRTEVNRE